MPKVIFKKVVALRFFEGGGLAIFVYEHFCSLDGVGLPFVLVQVTFLDQVLVYLRLFFSIYNGYLSFKGLNLFLFFLVSGC